VAAGRFGRPLARRWAAPAEAPGGRAVGCPAPGDSGNAIVEFVFLGVLLLAPLMYLVLAVSAVQRNLYGVTHAAREAGRAYATGTAANAADRARYAVRLALEDQGVPADDAVIRYGAVTAGCESASTEPWPATPGAEFAICVSRPFTVPGVPGFLVGTRSSVTGRYIVHLDEYRDYGSDTAGRPP
jgi:Flp pilus assembly protein TadG